MTEKTLRRTTFGSGISEFRYWVARSCSAGPVSIAVSMFLLAESSVSMAGPEFSSGDPAFVMHFNNQLVTSNASSEKFSDSGELQEHEGVRGARDSQRGLSVLGFESFVIQRQVFGAGAGESGGGRFFIQGTIGQIDANPNTMFGSEFSVVGGYWAGLNVSQVNWLFADDFEEQLD